MLIFPSSPTHQYYQLLLVRDKGKKSPKEKTLLVGHRPEFWHDPWFSFFLQLLSTWTAALKPGVKNSDRKDFLVFALCEGIHKQATRRGLGLQLFCPFHLVSHVNFSACHLFLGWFLALLSCYSITFLCQVHHKPAYVLLHHLLCNTSEHLHTTEPLLQHDYFLIFFSSHFLISSFQSLNISALTTQNISAPGQRQSISHHPQCVVHIMTPKKLKLH